MNSILLRLSAWLGVGLLVMLGLTWFFADRLMERVAERFLVEDLQHDVESLLLALRFDADGRARLDASRVEPVFQRPFSGHYYRVETEANRLVSRSLWDETLVVPDGSGTWRVPGPMGQRLFVLADRYEKDGHRFRLVVAEDLSGVEQVVSRMRRHYAVVMGILGMILGMGLIWMLRAALKPLERLRRDLQALHTGELRALSVAGAPREIRPLVDEINTLLGVLRERLDRQRKALGNLAHAIKTPLTVIFQHTAELRRGDCDESAVSGLFGAAESIRRVTERELQRARAAGHAPVGQRVALGEAVEEVVGVLRQAHADRALRFVLEVPEELQVCADREDLLEVLGNLLDNGAKWARSRVAIRARETAGDAVILRVEDDGPGMTRREIAAVLGRGARLDESVPGHGLGLAIVRDLVETYGGRLFLERSPSLGGLAAVVVLPRQLA
ncbi:MAG TPA: HAMP domain-containing histidine kinase [Chromatiales bacterium]|nr:HAMP domain-containing histidine kinase [Chromatiales bacterium]